MSGVVDSLPSGLRELFTEIVGAEKPDLFVALMGHDDPTPAERVGVHEVLTAEFSRNLQSNGEPTERGKRVDDLLGEFLRRWPVHGVWFKVTPEAGGGKSEGNPANGRLEGR